ncbi:hypothetical protein Tco_1450701 [Tanacetum coccineum]
MEAPRENSSAKVQLKDRLESIRDNMSTEDIIVKPYEDYPSYRSQRIFFTRAVTFNFNNLAYHEPEKGYLQLLTQKPNKIVTRDPEEELILDEEEEPIFDQEGDGGSHEDSIHFNSDREGDDRYDASQYSPKSADEMTHFAGDDRYDSSQSAPTSADEDSR